MGFELSDNCRTRQVSCHTEHSSLVIATCTLFAVPTPHKFKKNSPAMEPTPWVKFSPMILKSLTSHNLFTTILLLNPLYRKMRATGLFTHNSKTLVKTQKRTFWKLQTWHTQYNNINLVPRVSPLPTPFPGGETLAIYIVVRRGKNFAKKYCFLWT